MYHRGTNCSERCYKTDIPIRESDLAKESWNFIWPVVVDDK